jgi:general L-amino acid transport system permease protein
LAFRGLVYQIGAVALVVVVAAYMAINAEDALARRGIHFGFNFLFQAAGGSIGNTLLPFTATDSFFRAFLAGLINTLWVSAVSLVCATLLGMLLGIARLSSNWLVAKFASVYIECFRNTPQLVQIVFWFALITSLPHVRQAWHLSDWAYLSNRGLVIAWPAEHALVFWLGLAFLLGIALSVFVTRRADARQRRTGRVLPVFWIGLALVLGVPFVVWLLAGAPTALDMPHLRGFSFHGGVSLSGEFLALALGLSLYIAAYIAEIVRSGIQSVSRGQIEAGRAIGLDGANLYRKVIMPQALRVIVPPVTAQYISLVKTSSLGVLIGYPELFNVTNTVITLSGHTIESVLIMGLVYLLIALAISAAMNVYNKAIAIRER